MGQEICAFRSDGVGYTALPVSSYTETQAGAPEPVFVSLKPGKHREGVSGTVSRDRGVQFRSVGLRRGSERTAH